MIIDTQKKKRKNTKSLPQLAIHHITFIHHRHESYQHHLTVKSTANLLPGPAQLCHLYLSKIKTDTLKLSTVHNRSLLTMKIGNISQTYNLYALTNSLYAAPSNTNLFASCILTSHWSTLSIPHIYKSIFHAIYYLSIHHNILLHYHRFIYSYK